MRVIFPVQKKRQITHKFSKHNEFFVIFILWVPFWEALYVLLYVW